MYRKFSTTLVLISIYITLVYTHRLPEPIIGEILPTLIIKPLEGKAGDPGAVIFFQGADCTQESYRKHLVAVQEKVPFPLWIAMPHFIGDYAIPVALRVFADRAKRDLKDAIGGGTQVTKYFYGGHSLGGSSVAIYVHDDLKGKDAEGTFAWGAYVSHKIKDPAKNYPSPFLTVGAELDGWLARITRIAKSYDQM